MKYIVKCDILYLVMYMDILQLEYFCSAAELENFTLAAKRHFIPQSAMSITIKRLESELGEPLFARIGNRVSLNEAGKRFYLHAKRCISEFENAKKSVHPESEPTGEVRLLVLEERRIMAEMVTDFCRKYPGISFSICHNLFEENSGEYDIRVTADDKSDAASVSVQLVSENLMLAVSNTHRLAARDKVKISELSGERFIMMPQGNSLRRLTEKSCRKNGFVPKKSIICDDPFYARKYISAGLGISLVPTISWRGLFDKNISLIPIDGAAIVRTTMLECKRDSLSNASVQLFFDYCRSAGKNIY